MSKRTFDPATPYQSIRGASQITGLAQGYIREGCKSGRIPCVRVGQEYRICMRLFLQKLEAESVANMQRKGAKQYEQDDEVREDIRN